MSTTYTPDGKTKHDSITLPQDVINDVVVGTVNPPFQAVADNAAWLLLQAKNIRNAANFGATGDGSTDDGDALDDAIADLVTAGGGTLVLGEGRFRRTTKQLVPAIVSLLGIPGLTTIAIDSATLGCVERSAGGTAEQSNCIYGVNFEADQTDTGAAIEVSGLSALELIRCGVNTEDTKLTGYVINVSAGAPVTQIECKLVSAKTAPAAAFVCNTWRTFGGEIVMAPAASADLINCTDFAGFGTLFSQVSTLGGFAFFNAANAWSVRLLGCKFDVDDDAAGSVTYGINLHTGATVITCGNDFRTVAPYKLTSGPLADGTDLQLISSYSQATISGTTITLSDGYSSAYFSSDNATEPTVTLPKILFIGQEFQLVIRNVHGSGSWSGAPVFGGQGSNDVYVQGAGLSGVSDNGFLSIGWVAVYKEDQNRYAWVQRGSAVVL